jgi:hypothetical protein
MLAFAPLGFEYVSGREVARAASPKLSFGGRRVWEAQAFFERGSVRRVELSLYNRGDAGDIDAEALDRLVAAVSKTLTDWAGAAGRNAPIVSERAAHFVRMRQWARPPCSAQLSWGYTEPHRNEAVQLPFRAEFVRLTLLPAGSAVSDRSPAPVTAYTLKRRVRRASTGDVWVGDVPMVDQGEKGYCAAATAERLLRYYGHNVDQHEVAQLADTARVGGTSVKGMLDALRRIGNQYQLVTRALFDMDYNAIERLIRDYNRLAGSKGMAVIEYGNTIDIGQVFDQMNAAMLRKLRGDREREVERFLKSVRESADTGVPLIWACILGRFPENPPTRLQSSGGHVRLIVGYNTRRQEVLYSDSWGPGHELKRMPAAEAWTITFALDALKLRDMP